MTDGFDLDRLRVLAVLLDEGSVSGAARRLRLSSATLSRALARLRQDFGDPLLVASGRDLVLTPRAVALRPMVDALLSDARRLFEHGRPPDLSVATPCFTINANDAVTAAFCGPLLRAIQAECPGATVHFRPDADLNDGEALRRRDADLYIGATRTLRPEIRRRRLFGARMRMVVRAGHPLLRGPADAAALCRFDHVVVTRRRGARGPVDEALAAAGHERRIAMVLPAYLTALPMLAASDLVLQAPDFLAAGPDLPAGFAAVDFPFPLPEIALFQAWHPRDAAAPLHAWLRDLVQRVVDPRCAAPAPGRGPS